MIQKILFKQIQQTNKKNLEKCDDVFKENVNLTQIDNYYFLFCSFFLLIF